MKVGGQVLRNVTPICETSQIYYLMGRRPMKDVLGNHLKDLLFHLVHWLSITLQLRRTSQESINLERKSYLYCSSDTLSTRGEFGRVTYWSQTLRRWTHRKSTRKDSMRKRWYFPKKGEFTFPIADGRIKTLGRDQHWRTSTLIRHRPIQGESHVDFLGEREGSLPPPHDSFPASVTFWSSRKVVLTSRESLNVRTFLGRNAMSAHVWLLWISCVGLVPMTKEANNAHCARSSPRNTQKLTGWSLLHLADNRLSSCHWRSSGSLGLRTQQRGHSERCCVRYLRESSQTHVKARGAHFRLYVVASVCTCSVKGPRCWCDYLGPLPYDTIRFCAAALGARPGYSVADTAKGFPNYCAWLRWCTPKADIENKNIFLRVCTQSTCALTFLLSIFDLFLKMSKTFFLPQCLKYLFHFVARNGVAGDSATPQAESSDKEKTSEFMLRLVISIMCQRCARKHPPGCSSRHMACQDLFPRTLRQEESEEKQRRKEDRKRWGANKRWRSRRKKLQPKFRRTAQTPHSWQTPTKSLTRLKLKKKKMDWIHKKKHRRSQGKDGKRKDSMLEQDSPKMKWKLALRIATSPSDRWLRKAADWNPDLSTRYWINRAIGRPRKRWEDDINELRSNIAWEDRLGWFETSHGCRNFDRIDGEPIEFEWNIFPGFNTLQLSEEVKRLLLRLGETPENFTGRIIFMSMFNDISWRSKDNEKECLANAKLVSLYAKRFGKGQWSFIGPGSEKKWYCISEDSPQGVWDNMAERMLLEFAESGHPIFRATSPLSRGRLKSKGHGK